MKADIKKAWVNALRSGKYKQGRGRLCAVDHGDERLCCLGVLCELAVLDRVTTKTVGDDGVARYNSSLNYLPEDVQTWAGLSSYNPVVANGTHLASHNDGVNDVPAKSFDQIADLIEKHL
jgi:hypothetical protein